MINATGQWDQVVGYPLKLSWERCKLDGQFICPTLALIKLLCSALSLTFAEVNKRQEKTVEDPHSNLTFYHMKIKLSSGICVCFSGDEAAFQSPQRLRAAITLPCTCGMGSSHNDVAYSSWCCWVAPNVCTQHCDAPCLPVSQTWKAGVWQLMGRTLLRAPQLISPLMSYMSRTASFSFIWLYNNSDCLNKTVSLPTGCVYPFEAVERQVASMRSLKEA